MYIYIHPFIFIWDFLFSETIVINGTATKFFFYFLKSFLSYVATSIKQAELSMQNLELLLHDNFISGLEPLPNRNAFPLPSSNSFATDRQR